MNILTPMHIICLQKYSVQTKNRHIIEKTNVFRLKGLILLSTVNQNTQKLYSSLYFELISWFLQYLILRLNFAYFAVAEGWLLLDIG